MGEQYPKWVFHPNGASLIAKDFDDHQLRIAEGYLTAAEYDALPQPSAEPEMAAVVPPPADEVPASPDPLPTPDNGSTPFEDLSAKDAIARAAACTDVDALKSWRASEENRAGGGRATVLRALANKLGDSVVADLPASPDQIGREGE